MIILAIENSFPSLFPQSIRFGLRKLAFETGARGIWFVRLPGNFSGLIASHVIVQFGDSRPGQILPGRSYGFTPMRQHIAELPLG